MSLSPRFLVRSIAVSDMTDIALDLHDLIDLSDYHRTGRLHDRVRYRELSTESLDEIHEIDLREGAPDPLGASLDSKHNFWPERRRA